MTISGGSVVREQILDGYNNGPNHCLKALTCEEFEEKYNMSKEKWRELDKKYAATIDMDDSFIGCLSPEEIKNL